MRSLLAVVAAAGCASAAHAAVTVLGSFNAGLGALNAVGYDGDRVYVHDNGSASIFIFDRSGASIGSIANPPGNGNDGDIDFARSDVNINGTIVGAGTMLYTQGEQDPQRVYAINPLDGTILAVQNLAEPIGQLTGGSIANDGSFVTIDWTSDILRRFDLSDGSALGTISFGGGWDAFYSDVEVNAADGLIYMVSDAQGTVRVLDFAGNIVANIDVAALGVTGMSGIAFDDIRGEAWISSTNGTVYRLGGFENIPTPGALTALAGAGLLATRRRR